MNKSDLIVYKVRRTNRARKVRLSITSSGELIVSAPARVSQKYIDAFIHDNLAWIAQHQHFLEPLEIKDLPVSLELPAIDRSWSVNYQFGVARSGFDESHDHLLLNLRYKTVEHFQQVIARWLKYKASHEFYPRLVELSSRCGLIFKDFSVKGYKARWGSCSRQGDICLNYKLLLLPSEYVDYVIIHELCHTVHFNHSPQFWSLLAKYVQNWQYLRAVVKVANSCLPRWLRH